MEYKKLSELCSVAAGGTPKRDRNEYWENGSINWVKIKDIKYRYVTTTQEKITQLGLENSSAKIFPKGTILYTIFATLGEVAILEVDSTTNQAIAGIVPFSDKIDKDYLYYYLKSIKSKISSEGRGVAQNNINLEILKNIRIPLRSKITQKKIADTLDLASELIEKRKEQIAEMDKLVQSVYCQINKNETFDTMKVSDVVKKISTGKSYYSEEISTFKVLKTSAVSYGYFDDSQYKNLPREYDPPESTFVKKGDVLVSRMNTEELVGASAYVWKDSDFLTLPDRLWKLHVMENVDPIYLWKTLQQSYFRDSIRRNASGTSGSMKNISQKQFMSLKINIPNILIQKKFASIVEEIEAQKKLMEESLHEMENNFSALMKKAFRGELFPEE